MLLKYKLIPPVVLVKVVPNPIAPMRIPEQLDPIFDVAYAAITL